MRDREPRRWRPVPRVWLARLASPVAGGLPALAFPEPSLWPLAYIGLIPLLFLVWAAPTRREGAVRGWLGGAGFILTTHHWLYPQTGLFLLMIAAVSGLPWLAWGALAHRLLAVPAAQPGPDATAAPPERSEGRSAGRSSAQVIGAAALLAAAWVLIEAARSVEALGGPLGLLGSALWQVPPLLASAALGGVWLVGFLAVAANVGLAAAAARRTTAGGRLAGALLAAVAVGAGPIVAAARGEQAVDGTVRVAVVQVGVIDPADQRFDEGERITRTLAGRRDLDLVVWGESSVGADLEADPSLHRRVQALAATAGAPLLVNVDARQAARLTDPPVSDALRVGPTAGAPDRGAGGSRRGDGDGPAPIDLVRGVGIYKRSVLVTASGTAGRYDKQRLVPFGEYIPLRPALGWLTRLTPAAAEDRRRGTGPAWFELPAAHRRIGPLVCFESAFPDLSRRLAAGGADLIVAQSATTSFQESWGPEQHASLAAVRAMETGRPMLHATLSGTSAAFDARGRRLLWASTDARGVWVVTIPVAAGTTPYTRLGDWVPAASAAALVAWAVALAVGGVRNALPAARRRRGSRPTPNSAGERPSG